ncbi:MAG: MFS transporter [Curvibacter sp.]|nr:MAG: MFS transporter [Curvibacter sp.]
MAIEQARPGAGRARLSKKAATWQPPIDLAGPALESLNSLLLRRLMPLLILAYVISFIDRTNIALAKAQMSIDLGLSSAAYGLGAGLFFLSYAALEVPSNLIMHRVGARFWITRIMVSWGLLSAGMALVQGEWSFYLMRVLLGAAEAGLFPGVMLYLTYWFGLRERARATGYFLMGVCIANIVSGPLAGALMALDGLWGWHGWQWMFVLEGLPAVALAAVVWRYLPDGPDTAPWLTPAQRKLLQLHLAQQQAAQGQALGLTPAHPGKPDQQGHPVGGSMGQALRQCLRDRQIWLAIAVYFCHQISIYTVIFFLPGIIGGYGALSTLQVGLLTAVPWGVAALGAAVLPQRATTPQRSRRLLWVGLLVMAAGLVVGALGAAYAGPVLAMAGFCLTALMFFVVQPVLFLFPTSRLTGAALAAGIGLVNTVGLLGGFLGPSVMGLIEQQTGSTQNGLLIIAVLLVAAAVLSRGLRLGGEGV